MKFLIKYINVCIVILFSSHAYALESSQVIEAIPVIYQGNQGFFLKSKDVGRMPKTVKFIENTAPEGELNNGHFVNELGNELSQYELMLHKFYDNLLECKGNYSSCAAIGAPGTGLKYLLNESNPRLISGDSNSKFIVYIDNVLSVKPGDKFSAEAPYFLFYKDDLSGAIHLCGDTNFMVGSNVVKHKNHVAFSSKDI